MKFTIKKLTVQNAEVEFDNGTTAVVPLNKGLTNEGIIRRITGFNSVVEVESSVDDIPVKEGVEYDGWTEPVLDEELSYKEARKHHYPGIGNQLDALYWEREGDDTQRKALDARIKNVKDKITKDKTYKTSELDSLLD